MGATVPVATGDPPGWGWGAASAAVAQRGAERCLERLPSDQDRWPHAELQRSANAQAHSLSSVHLVYPSFPDLGLQGEKHE